MQKIKNANMDRNAEHVTAHVHNYDRHRTVSEQKQNETTYVFRGMEDDRLDVLRVPVEHRRTLEVALIVNYNERSTQQQVMETTK